MRTAQSYDREIEQLRREHSENCKRGLWVQAQTVNRKIIAAHNARKQHFEPEHDASTDYPYLLPTLKGAPTIQRFIGAVQTRIMQRQKALWSRVIGAGFVAEDITAIWPENNLEFFGIRYSGLMRSYRLADCNLRELEELFRWLIEHYGEQQEHKAD